MMSRQSSHSRNLEFQFVESKTEQVHWPRSIRDTWSTVSNGPRCIDGAVWNRSSSFGLDGAV